MNKALLLLAGLTSTNGDLEALAKKVEPYNHAPVYQHQQGERARFGGIFPVRFQPGPLQFRPFTNTHEYPWVHTAGYYRPVNHYAYFPEPIVYSDTIGGRPEHGDVERIIDWRYPPGTVFMEILTTQDIAFEVRTRTKSKEGTWRANVYRPYADADDLAAKLSKLGSRDARLLADAVGKLPRTPVRVQNKHTVKTFEFNGFREDLPEIPETLAKTVLAWPMVPHAAWKDDCHAPSTKSKNLSIVSQDYEGYQVKGDSKGCAQCHDTVLGHAFKINTNRDWYGRVRGSDGIFSFHIFDEASVSQSFETMQEPRLNGKLRLKWTEKH